jgi:hypothetical protein
MSYNNNIYCEKCINKPNAHSFNLISISANNNESSELSESSNTPFVFYTKIANAIDYDDVDGILEHYRKLLQLIDINEWIWIFDCDDLEIKHCFEITTSIGINKIIKENGKNKKIFIINSNVFLTIILDGIKFFLDNQISNNIEIFNKTEYNLFVNQLLKFNIDANILNANILNANT